MERSQGRYALVQFCPVPERGEFLNIGLLLIVPSSSFVGLRFARGQSRIDRFFGAQQKSYLSALKEGIAERIQREIEKSPDGSALAEFAAKRANDFRLSPLLPVMVDEPQRSLNLLFDALVGEDAPPPREPRVRQKLREALAAANVEQLLDRPEEVLLPDTGLKVSAPYGYQNGLYNFVDAMRLPSAPGEALREAGKRAFEGGLLWDQFANGPARKRLVVVGDFAKQSDGFYQAVRDRFQQAHVKLHRLDNIWPLIEDIRSNAAEHGRV